MKILILVIIIINLKNLYSYEIIRDQIFENFLKESFFSLTENRSINFKLIDDLKENAFVIDDSHIFFTKGILDKIKDENALISIMLHEYGHIKKKHVFQKKLKAQELKRYSKYVNMFSLLAGISLKSSEVMFGTSISLNEGLIQKFLINSRKFENEADNIMLEYMNNNKLNSLSTIEFLKHLNENNFNNTYRQTHPSTEERITKIKKNLSENYYEIKSKKFDFIKAKYFNNSKNKIYNSFFKNLKNGKALAIENDEMTVASYYELFKVGINKLNPIKIFELNINKYNNPYIKLEYLNYLIDNNNKNILLNKLGLYKIDKDVKKEFYFLYIMGKTYDYVGKINESYFYFCNFYKKISNNELSKYYCDKYDKNKIEIIDLVNEINVNIN